VAAFTDSATRRRTPRASPVETIRRVDNSWLFDVMFVPEEIWAV